MNGFCPVYIMLRRKDYSSRISQTSSGSLPLVSWLLVSSKRMRPLAWWSLLSLLAMGVDSPFVIYFKTVQIQLSPWCSFRSPQNNLEMGTWGSWVDTTSWSLAPVLASRDGDFEQLLDKVQFVLYCMGQYWGSKTEHMPPRGAKPIHLLWAMFFKLYWLRGGKRY